MNEQKIQTEIHKILPKISFAPTNFLILENTRNKQKTQTEIYSEILMAIFPEIKQHTLQYIHVHALVLFCSMYTIL